MKKFVYLAVAVGIAFPLAAKAQDQITAGQHGITQPGIMKSGADWIQTNYANKIVAGANEAMKDMDKKEAAGLTRTDAINVQGEALNNRWAGQNKLNENLATCQKNLQDARQVLASNPGDMKARDAAQVWANAYNQIAQKANDNSDRIDKLTTLVKAAGHNEVPPPPNHFDKIPIPAALPSELEMQKDGNKPPPPTDDKNAGGNSDDQNLRLPDKNPAKDPDKDLRDDMNTSMNTRDNLEALAPLALQYALDCQAKAQANPDDQGLQLEAKLASDMLNKLVTWHDNMQNRIWSDIDQIYPPVPDDKKSAGTQGARDATEVISDLTGAKVGLDGTLTSGDQTGDSKSAPGPQKSADGKKSDAKSEENTVDYPSGSDPIADMLHMGGVVVAMAPDQGQESTEQLVNIVSGNNATGGDTSNSTKNNATGAWEAARDAAKDAAAAARDAASAAAREGAHAASEGMRNCPDGH